VEKIPFLRKDDKPDYQIRLLEEYKYPIVEISFRDDYLLTLKDAKEITRKIGELSGGKKIRQLYIPGEFNEVDREVLDYSAGEEGQKYSYAEAYVVKSLALRIMGNFYLKVKKPLNPAQLFKTREEAINWLLSI
jgi:hypothetical protein